MYAYSIHYKASFEKIVIPARLNVFVFSVQILTKPTNVSITKMQNKINRWQPINPYKMCRISIFGNKRNKRK
jgi:hypothetical protein